MMRGLQLLADIAAAAGPTPALWWLGHCGFVVKSGRTILYIDPYLSNSQAERYRHSESPRERLLAAPLDPRWIRHADLVLCTHAHGAHLDWGTVSYLMAASPQARLVLPKSAIGRANALGVDYLRMIGTDADLRVDYGKDGETCEIVAVASAHEQLDWTEEGGYPYLGYVIRFGEHVIYHAGDCVPYPGLAEKLKRWGITVALLPINGRAQQGGMPGNFTIEEAADLAAAAGVQWLAPMHYGMFAANDVDINRFVDHMLGFRPAQRFKVFECGERWEIPAD
jgi:L-ascorbate metabolism protein UlaG (beta-lactamase superfamily)